MAQDMKNVIKIYKKKSSKYQKVRHAYKDDGMRYTIEIRCPRFPDCVKCEMKALTLSLGVENCLIVLEPCLQSGQFLQSTKIYSWMCFHAKNGGSP